jgi:hypothetical protein
MSKLHVHSVILLHAIKNTEKKFVLDDWAVPPAIDLNSTANGSNADASVVFYRTCMCMLT